MLLHVPIQRIEVIGRKCTEGAQQSLLCVHTSDMCIHASFGPCGGDVAITTPVLYSSPQTDVNWLFYYQLLFGLDGHHIHWLLLLLHLLLNQDHRGWSWGGCHCWFEIAKQLGQLPCTHLWTHLLKLCPAFCHQVMASCYCMNSCKLQKVHVF